MPQYDVIAVLGGGVRAGGVLPSWVRRRFDRALEVSNDAFIMPLSASTTHRPPPLQENGFPIHEAIAGARYLRERGVPLDRILVEACSYDTIGNAYFSRVVHVDPRRFRRLLIITSDWHMLRTRVAFDWVYSLTPKAVDYELEYESVDDPEMGEQVKAGRLQKEEAGIAALRHMSASISTLDSFHRWLFTSHCAYNADATAFGGAKLTQETLQSY